MRCHRLGTHRVEDNSGLGLSSRGDETPNRQAAMIPELWSVYKDIGNEMGSCYPDVATRPRP